MVLAMMMLAALRPAEVEADRSRNRKRRNNPHLADLRFFILAYIRLEPHNHYPVGSAHTILPI
jgi:hypothetical protein